MHRIKVFLVIAAVILLATIPMLFAAEYVARGVLGLGEPILYRPSLAWGYAPVENQQVTRRRGSTVTINDAGLRALQPWGGEDREKILFLGDSVTFGGTYMDDSAIFSVLTCGESGRFACYNGGVNAYGVMNMVARSRYDDRLAGADVVVFVAITGDFRRGLQDETTAHFMMRRPNGLFPALHEILGFVAARYDLNVLLNKCCGPAQTDAERAEDARDAIDWSMELLAREAARLDAAGTRVLVAFSPDKAQYLNGRDADTDYMFAAAARHGLEMVDLTPVLRDSGEPLEALYYDIVHYEAGAHRAVASFFSETLLGEAADGRN